MTEHFHIMTGVANAQPVADAIFLEYKDSLDAFLGLARDFYESMRNMDEGEAMVKTLQATGYGAARGAYIGPPSLMIYWLRCDETHHDNPTWN